MTEAHPHECFVVDDKPLDVERVGKSWQLRYEKSAVRTKDLSAGLDELLGRGRRNMGLALRILEWDAGMNGSM